MRTFSLLSLSILIFGLTACKSTRSVGSDEMPVASGSTALQAHDNLNAVLWMQSSAEYAALCRQAFMAAQLALDEALVTEDWTAASEQDVSAELAELPPAIIVDIDETVLDNSPYQAGLINSNQSYSSASWKEWTARKSALSIPGALDFLREVNMREVTIFYISNRKAEEEEATRANLLAQGFPVSDATDVVLLRGERPEWDTSDKTPRRKEVAKNYRILQLLGDNLGDFIQAEAVDAQSRRALVEQFSEYWGLRWIVLPNPSYGDWEAALLGKPSPGSEDASGAKKRAQLRVN